MMPRRPIDREYMQAARNIRFQVTQAAQRPRGVVTWHDHGVGSRDRSAT